MDDNNKKALIVAYYLSKYNSTSLDRLGYKTQADCFEDISKILGINKNSIRNMRDEFDPLHDNSRQGFKKNKLSPSRQEVVDNYGMHDEINLFKIVKAILAESTKGKDNDAMLVDLNNLAIVSREKYLKEFLPGDISLPDDFKREFGTFLRGKGSDVVFYNATSTVTTSGNKKIFVPNQWYIIAAYMVEYVKALFEYKKHLDKIFDIMAFDSKTRENFIKDMKTESTEQKRNTFKDECRAYFNNKSQDLEKDSEYMVRFISEYDWWFGSKTIDRGDFYVSPVLSLLGVVNVSQAYIAEICFYYAISNELSRVLSVLNKQSLAATPPVYSVPEVATSRLTGGVNLIVYGAPGTGKSRYLEDHFGGSNTKRVIFHPEYTYFDFIGSYKPVPLYKEGLVLHTITGEKFSHGEPIIDYQFVPGPFVSVFVSAWLNPNKMHTLLIEEINRANAASVFGEIFQLLDRKPDGSGEYSITPPKDLMNYLGSIDGMQPHICSGITLPSNMNIVATMNSADQGVNLLDAAFKRRWAFRYIKVSVSGAVHEKYRLVYNGVHVYWGDLVSAINSKLKDLRIEEDRMVGPYFIRPDEVEKPAATDKLLLYLWDDVLRHRRDQFFDNSIRTFADLVEGFSTNDVLQLSQFLNIEEVFEVNSGSESLIDTESDSPESD